MVVAEAVVVVAEAVVVTSGLNTVATAARGVECLVAASKGA